MTDLGAFDERIRSWRAILAAIPRPDARLKTFVLAANDIACCTARGLPIAAAADVLQEIAETQDLIETFGADEVQSIIGNAFDNVESVPDLLELPAPKPKANGQHAPGGSPKGRTSLLLKKFGDLLLSTVPNYLIKGLLPRTGIAVIWGAPKSGKSFFTFDIAMHVALGLGYRGRKVRQGTVVYLALEGGGGFAARVEAWRRRHELADDVRVPFYLLDVPLDLVANHAALIEAIKLQVIDAPVLIVIDTLNRALAGDENKSDDMAKFIRAVDELRKALGSLVALVHHCGVAGNRPRGHTSLSGADDVQISVTRGDDVIIAAVDHLKDGEAGPPLGFTLERVGLGTDDDGDEISSCVVEPAEIEDKGTSRQRLSPRQKIALELLADVTLDTGTPAPAHLGLPQGVRVVFVDAWKAALRNRGQWEGKNPRARFLELRDALMARKLIGYWSPPGAGPDADAVALVWDARR